MDIPLSPSLSDGIDNPLDPEEERRKRAEAAAMFASQALPNDLAAQVADTHGRAVMDAQQASAAEPLLPPSAMPVVARPAAGLPAPEVAPVVPAAVHTPAAPRHATGGGGHAQAAAGPAVTGPTDKERTAVTEQQRAAITGQTKVDMDRSTQEVLQSQNEQHEIQQVDQWAESKRKETHGYLAKTREEISTYKPTDLFEGREAARVAAWVAAGIGQIGAALSGGPNTAIQVLNSAADSWERKETQRYQRLVAKGEMAKEDMDLAELEIKNKRVGILEGFVRQRTELTAKLNGREAAAKGDALTAALSKQVLDEKTALAEKADELVLKKKQVQLQEITARAGAAASYANAGESNARADLARAQAAAAGTVGGASGGRAAGKMIDLALLHTQLKDDLDDIKAGLADPKAQVGVKEFSLVQKNLLNLKGAEHTASAGLGGSLAVNWLRDIGAAPKTAFTGLSAAQRNYMIALDLIATKAAGQIGNTVEERNHAKADLMPAGDDPPEVVTRKIDKLVSMAGGIGALGAGYTKIAQQGAETERAGMGTPPSTQAIAQAQKWINDNPNDPRTPARKEKLRLMVSGALR